jgi:23S rRNA (cytidine2498-2'-O)-methyltransferase
MDPIDATCYLAAPGFEAQLLAELRRVTAVHERLVIARGPRQEACWAQNVWLEPVHLEVDSVKDAARKLRAIQRNWALYSCRLHRRAGLIQAQLPHVSAKPLEFPSPAPTAPLGSWTLLGEHEVLASPECASPFPNGEARFEEFKVGPPTRAYLKLWEALTLLGERPGPGDRCLDAGCCPGGWTWALARLGARVTAVDRAPLEGSVAKLSGVEYRKGSAFSLRPPRDGPFDWIFSDVVCYPERLWEWVRAWLESSDATRFVCTLKFQGDSHYGAIRDFASVPGSRVVHLSHNKHELTWMLARK